MATGKSKTAPLIYYVTGVHSDYRRNEEQRKGLSELCVINVITGSGNKMKTQKFKLEMHRRSDCLFVN